jgi:hypothetical protein
LATLIMGHVKKWGRERVCSVLIINRIHDLEWF